jgi:hypothetical protein
MKAHTQDDGLTWLFSNRSTVVKAHKPDCGMLRTANTRSGIVAITKPDDKADLIARGFKVTVCKCAKI